MGSSQDEGVLGRMVGGMIRRSVRRSFRNVYWIPPDRLPTAPVILVANHHGWHDGYLMYHAVSRLGLRSLDWIAEFDAFPLFARIGGMPFPASSAGRRAATVRRTVRLMRTERRSLVLFAEGVLHSPPDLLPFGRALELVASRVPSCVVLPVGIRYDMSLHERPEAIVAFGDSVPLGEGLRRRCRDAVAEVLARVEALSAGERAGLEVLVRGTPDVNERWDMRKIPGKSSRASRS